MRSHLTLEDMNAIIKLQNSINYDVPDFYTSWDLAEQATIAEIIELRDVNFLRKYLDDRFIVLYFENMVDRLSSNSQNTINNCQNL